MRPSPRRRPPSAAADRAPLADTIVVVAALVVLNVAQDLLPSGSVWFGVLGAAVLLAYARRAGLSWEQLGLGRARLRSGGGWAAAAVATVAGTYLVGVLLPRTRAAFLDPRYAGGVPEALVAAFWVIPLRTVLLEEVAFRSVLWALLSRHTGTAGSQVVSSSLFGLWHVLPSLDFAAARGLDGGAGASGRTRLPVVLGTVGFTALGGAVAGELRRRSGSVLASAGMHWATNSLGVLFGTLARRLPA